MLAGTFFVCGATTNGLVSTHLIPAAHDHGIAQVSAASLLALIGVFDIVGTVASGWLTDRFDARRLLLVYYGFRGLALLALPVAFDSARGARRLRSRLRARLRRRCRPLRRSRQRRSTGRRGSCSRIFSAHQFGAAAAAGLVRTSTGEYTAAWAAAGGLALLAAVAVLLISATPRRPVEAAATA